MKHAKAPASSVDKSDAHSQAPSDVAATSMTSTMLPPPLDGLQKRSAPAFAGAGGVLDREAMPQMATVSGLQGTGNANQCKILPSSSQNSANCLSLLFSYPKNPVLWHFSTEGACLADGKCAPHVSRISRVPRDSRLTRVPMTPVPCANVQLACSFRHLGCLAHGAEL